MSRTVRYRLILIIIAVTVLSAAHTSHADIFETRDTQIDLPILSIPNNAVNPQISADQSGHIYIAWSDNRGGSPSIYVNSFLPDQGWQPRATKIPTGFPQAQGAQPGDATSPQICSDNSGHVYVSWVDDRAQKAGTGKKDIFFRYSKDFGLTWYPEFTDERIDSDNPAIGDSLAPRMSCDDQGNVFIVWNDDRVRTGIFEVYFRSLQVQFNIPTDFIIFHQTPESRLNTGVTAGIYPALQPAISSDPNGNVYVAWQDNRNKPEEDTYPGIYFNVSRNLGSSWLSQALHIDTAPIGGFLFFSPPVIGSDDSGHVYVAWIDNAGRAARGDPYAPDGTSDVYFSHSNDHGMTWQEDDTRIEATDLQGEARNVALGNNNKGVVSVSWAEDREGAYNIFLNHSEDFGRSFLDSKSNIRIDVGVLPGSTDADSPLVKVDNFGNAYVTWVDNRTGTSDIYFNFSAQRGREDSWQDYDITLDYPVPPGNSRFPVMAVNNLGGVFIAWQDSRNTLATDNYNIFTVSGFLDIELLQLAGQRIGDECFIATAAYGSPFEKHVELLRDFRDQYLLTNRPGCWFVSSYYRLSPPVARFIAGHSYVRAVVRVALIPVVGVAVLFVYTTLWQKVVISGILLAILAFVVLKSPLLPLYKRGR